MCSRKLNLVVAACNNRGIGINGSLPWRLKGDMAFFKRITKETRDPTLKNAVIMGRKTWESIPQKFRPLAGRTNIVISRNWKEAPEGAHLAHSLDEAVDLCSSEKLSPELEGLFVIGGSSVYELALASPLCHRIYFTKVEADFECDTFLPEFDTQVFRKVEDENVDGEEKEENDIRYNFEVYERKTEESN